MLWVLFELYRAFLHLIFRLSCVRPADTQSNGALRRVSEMWSNEKKKEEGKAWTNNERTHRNRKTLY